MKRYLLAIVASALMCALIMVVTLLSMPDMSVSSEAIRDADSVLSDVSMTAVNAKLTDKLAFRVQADDAQLYIDGIDDEISALIVEFKKPLPESTRYQLFYSMDGLGLNEYYSVLQRTTESTDTLVIRLPYFRTYDLFRLDIDRNYRLRDISVIKERKPSDSYLAGILSGRLSFPYKHAIMLWFVLLVGSLLLAWKLERVKQWLRRSAESIRAGRAGILRAVVICLACMLVSALIWDQMYRMGLGISKSKYGLLCFIDVGLAVGLLIAMGRQLPQHPERGFLVIAMCVGLLFIIAEPPIVYLTWDDETHYARALRVSYLNTYYISEPENIASSMRLSNEISLENKLTTTDLLNALPFRDGGNLNNTVSNPYYTLPPYLPIGGGIWLARLLGFSFEVTYMAGRLGNLLCYVLVAYFAIRQLKYGRLFAISLCLIPTILFLAGNYSYDPFCIAFIMLGTCIWLGVWQRPESRMSGEKAAVMLAAFALGVLPKTVYFPVVLIAAFLPKTRFANAAAARRYRAAVLLTTLLLMFSIVLPFIGSGSGNQMFTDTRGGAEVGATSQIKFILSDPVGYVGILLRYLFNVYFNMDNIMSPTGGCVRAFAFIGVQGVVFPETIAWAFLGVAFMAWLLSFDINISAGERMSIWVKLLCAALTFGTICLAATSLYCAFTPVGSDTIAGFQERYMLPVVLPMLLVIRPCVQLKRPTVAGWPTVVVICAQAALLLMGVWPLVQRIL